METLEDLAGKFKQTVCKHWGKARDSDYDCFEIKTEQITIRVRRNGKISIWQPTNEITVYADLYETAKLIKAFISIKTEPKD